MYRAISDVEASDDPEGISRALHATTNNLFPTSDSHLFEHRPAGRLQKVTARRVRVYMRCVEELQVSYWTEGAGPSGPPL